MSLARSTAPLEEVQRLRAQMDRVQRRRVDVAVLPVAEPLSTLFPEGGLRQGAVYSWDGSTSLLLALLSMPSRAGSWCAAVGFPELGIEAAEGFGIALDRLVLIPEPGTRWLPVVSALSEVVPMIAVRASGRVSDAEMSRMSARLRDRGGVLLVTGDWNGAEATLGLQDPVWEGLGDGHGMLRSRTVTVTAAGRRAPLTRRARVLLPDANGAVSVVPAASSAVTDLDRDRRTDDRTVRPLRSLQVAG